MKEARFSFADVASVVPSAQEILKSNLHFAFNFNITNWPKGVSQEVTDLGCGKAEKKQGLSVTLSCSPGKPWGPA